MLELDGSMGEGGGQVLRTALSLSLCLGRPFRMTQIRAARSRPGLQRQHLAAVTAAAQIGDAAVAGAELHSQTLSFSPRDVRPGEYRFDIGSAGSTTLVLQTVLPPLMLRPGPSRLVIQGGTHNPLAPPFEFIRDAFVPLLRRMGAAVDVELTRPGFYPVGGGELVSVIQPSPELQSLRLLDRGALASVTAVVWLSQLPLHIWEREADVLARGLSLAPQAIHLHTQQAAGPGNAVCVSVTSSGVCEVFSAIGRKGLPAEKVASGVVQAVQEYLAATAPVGAHLADQLLLPLALAGGGEFLATALTLHAQTNAQVIERFGVARVHITEETCGVRFRIEGVH